MRRRSRRPDRAPSRAGRRSTPRIRPPSASHESPARSWRASASSPCHRDPRRPKASPWRAAAPRRLPAGRDAPACSDTSAACGPRSCPCRDPVTSVRGRFATTARADRDVRARCRRGRPRARRTRGHARAAGRPVPARGAGHWRVPSARSARVGLRPSGSSATTGRRATATPALHCVRHRPWSGHAPWSDARSIRRRGATTGRRAGDRRDARSRVHTIPRSATDE